MRFVTVAGPPSSGKTSVILATIEHLRAKGLSVGVVKFDCLSTSDAQSYRRHDVPVQVGFALKEVDAERLLEFLANEQLNLFYLRLPVEIGVTGKVLADPPPNP